MTSQAFAPSTTLPSNAPAGDQGRLRQLLASTPLAVFVCAVRSALR
jgi:hypothetical protein